MKRIDALFHVQYPSTLVFGHQRTVPGGTPFVTSTGRNNGIAGRVAPISGAKLYPAGAITVPLKGSVMQAFLQPEPFHCAHQIAVLTPKAPMSDAEKLFYVSCLRANEFRFSYGRQADRTFRNLLVPDETQMPDWVLAAKTRDLEQVKRPWISDSRPDLDTAHWDAFSFEQLFDIKKGKRLTKAMHRPGTTPFIGAIESNNGLTGRIAQAPRHPSGTITVNYNGNGVAEAFYQAQPFWASDDVNVLYPKFPIDLPVALFLCTVIRLEKPRFSYGRKWHLERMKASVIKLPVRSKGEPDWDYMRKFVQSLAFSSQLAA